MVKLKLYRADLYTIIFSWPDRRILRIRDSPLQNKTAEKIVAITKHDNRFHQITGDDALHKQFITAYPPDRLSEMLLADYCLGYGSKSNNFCWWLERGLEPALGRYSPGTAKGHLIFQKKDGSYYKHRRFSDMTDEDAMSYVAKIHHTIANVDPDDCAWLDDHDQIYKLSLIHISEPTRPY